MTERERETIQAIAAELGVGPGTPAGRALHTLLASPRDEAYFVEARDVLAAVIDTMPTMEARVRRMDAVDYCREVAMASGGLLARIGLGAAISAEERETISRVSARLSGRPSDGRAGVDLVAC